MPSASDSLPDVISPTPLTESQQPSETVPAFALVPFFPLFLYTSPAVLAISRRLYSFTLFFEASVTIGNGRLGGSLIRTIRIKIEQRL